MAAAPGADPPLTRSPTLADGLLAVGLAVLGAATGVVLVAPAAAGVDAPAPGVVVVWAVALAAPLLVRRRFPCTVLVVTSGHFAVYWAVGQVHEIASWLVLGVAVYGAAAYGHRPTATWWSAAGLVGTTALFSGTALAAGTSLLAAAVLAIGNALPYLLGWPLGHATRQVRAYRALLEERNADLERGRAAETRGAVLEERVRIARELHDVLAHHVSLIGIQAGVAARLFSARPDAWSARPARRPAGAGALADRPSQAASMAVPRARGAVRPGRRIPDQPDHLQIGHHGRAGPGPLATVAAARVAPTRAVARAGRAGPDLAGLPSAPAAARRWRALGAAAGHRLAPPPSRALGSTSESIDGGRAS